MIKLTDTPLFKGFSDTEVEISLKHLKNRTPEFEKNETVFLEGDRVTELGIVLSGSVSLERIDYQGNKNILGLVTAGHIFAETYALTKKPIMIDVISNERTKVFFIEIDNLTRKPVAESWYYKLLTNLLMVSSNKNLELSERSFHTFPKHIRNRVLSYLSSVSNEKGSDSFDIPLNRQQMADYLNLDRSALSAELCKMRDEGLITFRKNHFRINR